MITKSDLVDSGAEGSVIALLKGKKMDSFELGFHAVKLRNQRDVTNQKSLAASLAEEATFFSTAESWRSVADRSLLGIRTLLPKLGELYMRLVRDSVPELIEELRTKLGTASTALKVCMFRSNFSQLASLLTLVDLVVHVLHD